MGLFKLKLRNMNEQEILEAIKELHIKEFGSLSYEGRRDGYFIVGFVQAAINSIKTEIDPNNNTNF